MSQDSFTVKGFVVWATCALFFLYEFLLRTVVGTYQQALMKDLSLTSFQFSLISASVFLLVYGCMQIPVGIIADNIGIKKSMLLGAVCCAVSCFGFANSSSYFFAVFFRSTMGAGAAFGFICLLISVYEWMPRRNCALFIGLSQFIGTMGPMLAAGPLEDLSASSSLTWRFMFSLLGVVGAVIALMVALFVENNHQKTGGYTVLYKPEKITNLITKLFTKRQPWVIAIFSACVYFAIEYLSENEGRAFLILKGLSLHNASYMLTLSWVGYALGCPFLGFLSDLLQRRRAIIVSSAMLSVLSVLGIVYLERQELLVVSFFLLGVSASGQSIGFAIMGEQFKENAIAVGLGLNNAFITGFAAVCAPILGAAIDYLAQGDQISLANYTAVFNIIILISTLALIVSWLFIRETFCKSRANFFVLKVKKSL